MNYDFEFEKLDNVIKVTRKTYNKDTESPYYRIVIHFKNSFEISLMWGLK